MARGGYRPNSGPKKGTKYSPRAKKTDSKIKNKQEKTLGVYEDIKQSAAAEGLSPLAYMLRVINDEQAEKDRRDRLAVAAAPYCHPRKGEGLGKKEEMEGKAKKAGEGRFRASAPPLTVVK